MSATTAINYEAIAGGSLSGFIGGAAAVGLFQSVTGRLAPPPNTNAALTPVDGSDLINTAAISERLIENGPPILVIPPQFQGPRGPVGSAGSQGPTGPAGVQGPPGPAGGPAGPVGPAGPDGTNGTNGAPGATGLPGPQGVTGPAGATGPTGPTGDTGPAGATGPTGIQGLQGNVGLKGAQGAKGVDGINGTNGATGPQGPKGPTGANGAIGPKGATGPPGIAGIAGIAGPAGPQGVKGPTGDQGPLGAAGLQGPQGLPGDPGGGTDLTLVSNFSNAASNGCETIRIGQDAGFNQLNGAQGVNIGCKAGSNLNGASNTVAIGRNANATPGTPINGSIAVGANSKGVVVVGTSTTTTNFAEIGIGHQIGGRSTYLSMGSFAGASNPDSPFSVLLGYQAGRIRTSTNTTGGNVQFGLNCTSIGTNANLSNSLRDSEASLAIGSNAGSFDQSRESTAIGTNAGFCNQGVLTDHALDARNYTTAIGLNAGQSNQRAFALAVGTNAGAADQRGNAVAIGTNAGSSNQMQGTYCFQNTNIVAGNAATEALFAFNADTANAAATPGFPVASATTSSLGTQDGWMRINFYEGATLRRKWIPLYTTTT
jgi:hypothetical protein